MKAPRDSWLNPLLALLLCATGGAVFATLRTPLPWMIGPLLMMAIWNFSGARLRSFRFGRQAGQLIIGTALGLYFTPVVARQVLSTWPLLLSAAFFAIALAWACGWFLSKSTGVDRTTAFFASVPGGAAEMTVLGERYGAKVDRVVFAQTLRILVVVIVVPFGLTYSGVHGSDLYIPATVPLSEGRLLVLFTTTAAAGTLATFLRMPNPFMFGPLLATIALTSNEISLSSVPTPLTNIGQLMLGCALGSRFEREFLVGLRRYAAAVLGSIFLAMGLAVLFSVFLAWVTGIPVASLVLATAPGGIAEMCVTAKVLQLGVPLVTAAHVTRVLILVNATAPVYRAAKFLARR